MVVIGLAKDLVSRSLEDESPFLFKKERGGVGEALVLGGQQQ